MSNYKKSVNATNINSSETSFEQPHYDNRITNDEINSNLNQDSLDSNSKNNSQLTVLGGNDVYYSHSTHTIYQNSSIAKEKKQSGDNNTVIELYEGESCSASPISSGSAILVENKNKEKLDNSLNQESKVINLENMQFEDNSHKSPEIVNLNNDFTELKPLTEDPNEVNNEKLITKIEDKMIDSKNTLTDLKDFLNTKFGLDDVVEVIKRQSENRVLQSLLPELDPEFLETIYLQVSTVTVYLYFKFYILYFLLN